MLSVISLLKANLSGKLFLFLVAILNAGAHSLCMCMCVCVCDYDSERRTRTNLIAIEHCSSHASTYMLDDNIGAI